MMKIRLEDGSIRVEAAAADCQKFWSLTGFATMAVSLDQFVAAMSPDARAAIRNVMDEEPAFAQPSLFDAIDEKKPEESERALFGAGLYGQFVCEPAV